MGMPEVKISYNLTTEWIIFFALLSGALSTTDSVIQFLIGVGYGLIVLIALFILSFIPIVGQLLLWFIVMPLCQNYLEISSPHLLLFNIIALSFSVFFSLLALMIYTSKSTMDKYLS